MSQRGGAGAAGAAATRAGRDSISQRLGVAMWPAPRCRRAASRPGGAGGPSPAPGLAHRENPGSGMRRATTARPAAEPTSSMIHRGEGIRARPAEAGASAEPAPPGSSPEEDHLPCILRASPTGPHTALQPGTVCIPSIASPAYRHSILSVHAAERAADARYGRRRAGPPPWLRLHATWCAALLRARPGPATATVHIFTADPDCRAR